MKLHQHYQNQTLMKQQYQLKPIQIQFQMNIFELIVSDPSNYQQVSSELTHHNQNWTLFRHNLQTLFSTMPLDIEPFISRTRQLWSHTLRTSPELINIMIEYYQNELQKLIEGVLEPNLRQIGQTLGSNKSYLEMELSTSLEAVHERYLVHDRYIRIFDKENRFIDIFRKKIHSLLIKYNIKSKVFTLLKNCYYKNALNTLKSEILQFDEDVQEHIRERCSGCEQCNYEPQKLKPIFQKLIVLNLTEEYFEDFYDFLNKESEIFITSTTNFSEGKDSLTKCLTFQRTFQKHFLKMIKSPNTEDFFTRIINQLDDNTYYLYAKHCSRNILDIILDYPDSQDVIESLRKCLKKASLLNEVGQYLSQEIERRLLIPGVITRNILDQYINMLKVLQILDPQGLIFEKITIPIKTYLLKRNDTLRCIISHLTEDYSNLTKQKVRYLSADIIEAQSSEEDQNLANQWQTLTVKQQKIKKKVRYQQIDLVTVLVGLYGSQEAFIGQYQNMMAQKLMSAKDYKIEEEMKNVELLKMRFGESALQTCNIIIKDVQDSRRNDGVIHSKKGHHKHRAPISINQLNCLSVSKGYWPINYENTSSFNFPPEMKQIFQEYSKRFSQIKAMRKIFFHYNLGYVNLTLSFDNGDFPFKCLPLQALMITYLDESKMKDPKQGISSDQLSHELQIPPNIVKQKMSFWVHKGVVKETRTPKFGGSLSLRKMPSTIEDSEVIYYKPVNHYENVAKEQIEDDFESALIKQSSSIESHLKHILEGLILSILNTNGPKSLEKIHLLLKTVYKTDLDYTYGEVQTAQILKKMLQKKKINFNGEVYSSKEE